MGFKIVSTLLRVVICLLYVDGELQTQRSVSDDVQNGVSEQPGTCDSEQHSFSWNETHPLRCDSPAQENKRSPFFRLDIHDFMSRLRNFAKEMDRVQLKVICLFIVFMALLLFPIISSIAGQSDNRQSSIEEPAALLCPITNVMFRDPVVTAHGNTYERSLLLQFWRQTGSAKDPLSNVDVSRVVITNWGKRREVASFLQEHAGYIPQGWLNRDQPSPKEVIPGSGGFVVGDEVVCVGARFTSGSCEISPGDFGKVIGAAGMDLKCEHVWCEFPGKGCGDVPQAVLAKRLLPGGFTIGEEVVSLIRHSSPNFGDVHTGDVGRVVCSTSKDGTKRIICDFAGNKGCAVFMDQITKLHIPGPGNFVVGDEVVSTMDYSSITKGEIGVIVRHSLDDAESRLVCDFPRCKGVDIPRSLVVKRKLPGPGNFLMYDEIVSLVDLETVNVKKGDIGRVVGASNAEPASERNIILCDFPQTLGVVLKQSDITKRHLGGGLMVGDEVVNVRSSSIPRGAKGIVVAGATVYHQGATVKVAFDEIGLMTVPMRNIRCICCTSAERWACALGACDSDDSDSSTSSKESFSKDIQDMDRLNVSELRALLTHRGIQWSISDREEELQDKVVEGLGISELRALLTRKGIPWSISDSVDTLRARRRCQLRNWLHPSTANE